MTTMHGVGIYGGREVPIGSASYTDPVKEAFEQTTFEWLVFLEEKYDDLLRLGNGRNGQEYRQTDKLEEQIEILKAQLGIQDDPDLELQYLESKPSKSIAPVPGVNC